MTSLKTLKGGVVFVVFGRKRQSACLVHISLSLFPFLKSMPLTSFYISFV
jgi:hypothetical protein